MRYMVNGVETEVTGADMDSMCEYCGAPGCVWQNHTEARADVRAWQREAASMDAPFGDYRGE